MLAIDCPCGKTVCDDCIFLRDAACTYERNVQYSITANEIREMNRKERERLLSLPKETLVQMIMGNSYYNTFPYTF